jgi:hypothetical protein
LDDNAQSKLFDYYPDLSSPAYTNPELPDIIPNNMNIADWGPNHSKSDGHVEIDMGKVKAQVIKLADNKNVVTILAKQPLGGYQQLTQFVDHAKKRTKSLDSFVRKFETTTIHYKKGVKTYHTKQMDYPFFTKIKPQKASASKIITMDLETRQIGGRMEVVCVSIYILGPGKKSILKTFGI